jgi:hypothetical protein
MRFSVRSLLVFAFYLSLWMSGWGIFKFYTDHTTRDPFLLLVATASLIFACPFGLFGYIVGRSILGIVYGLLASALNIGLFLLIIYRHL